MLSHLKFLQHQVGRAVPGHHSPGLPLRDTLQFPNQGERMLVNVNVCMLFNRCVRVTLLQILQHIPISYIVVVIGT